jgi:hypothetical protein
VQKSAFRALFNGKNLSLFVAPEKIQTRDYKSTQCETEANREKNKAVI